VRPKRRHLMWNRLKTSSKWQLAAITFLYTIGGPWWTKLGMTEDTFSKIWMGFIGLLGAQSAADWGKEAKTS